MKRACEVAVSGMHNFLMVGATGSGKTMTARAIPSILPPLSREEELSIASIYSVCGKFGELFLNGGRRPFRSPHHSISARLLSGGGSVAYPESSRFLTKEYCSLMNLPSLMTRHLRS